MISLRLFFTHMKAAIHLSFLSKVELFVAMESQIFPQCNSRPTLIFNIHKNICEKLHNRLYMCQVQHSLVTGDEQKTVKTDT